ncbi:hypothetical protein BN8_06325 [Fibrisoma limi BUZ 3]|uniref:Uncharacterized protein n=2 Tax=Fibrisoma limi TaxID=663275 RepID=I2GSQ6_9BACT|nr:hypothetical protein BN8_06325 [Fibrisoma limi BUZ 3]
MPLWLWGAIDNVTFNQINKSIGFLTKKLDVSMASMLEYIKTILQKVSFDKALFEKELRKAIAMLVPEEIKQLKTWCYAQFGKIYRVVLNRCFSRVRFS